MYGNDSLENKIRQKGVAFEEELCHEYETSVMNIGDLHHEYKRSCILKVTFLATFLGG